MGTPSQSYGTSLCHMGSDSVTCHPTQVNAPRLTPAMQAGTRFTYSGGMEGWVDLVDLIVPRPGVGPATFRSRVRRRTAATPGQDYIRAGYYCRTWRWWRRTPVTTVVNSELRVSGWVKSSLQVAPPAYWNKSHCVWKRRLAKALSAKCLEVCCCVLSIQPS